MVSYIYTDLPVNVIVRLPHPLSGDSLGQRTFLALSSDKQSRKYHTLIYKEQVQKIIVEDNLFYTYIKNNGFKGIYLIIFAFSRAGRVSFVDQCDRHMKKTALSPLIKLP